MPENKGKKDKDTSRPDDVEPGASESQNDEAPKALFDLQDVLAVGLPVTLPITPGIYAPVPVTFGGHRYVIGREYTGSQVSEFFALLRVKGQDMAIPVLEKVLVEGDPAQLDADIGVLSIFESNRLFEGIYKIAGLMNLSGKFLAS